MKRIVRTYGSMSDKRDPNPTAFVNKWLTRLVIALIVIVGCALLFGCTTVRPLVEVSHTSHATQHFGSNRTNYGWNVYSVGVRWRPVRGVTVDLLEGYSPEKLDGRHEVFQGRVQWEVGQ